MRGVSYLQRMVLFFALFFNTELTYRYSGYCFNWSLCNLFTERRKKLNKVQLAEWLEEQGVDVEDINILKSRFLKKFIFV